ncbi:MAG: TAXI family TRAP transporter solute-binding subunit [Qingshengfaniella sp.]
MRTLTRILGLTLTLVAGSAAGTAGAKDYYRMATLPPGSSPYMVMSTFANIVNQQLDDTEIQVNATGVATAHAIQAAQGQLDFFMMAPIVHNFMQQGTAMYAGIPGAPEMAETLRSIFIFPLGLYHIVTRDGSGIETLADLKGHTVFLGPPGGSARTSMLQLVEGTTGMKPGEDFTSVDVGWDAAAQSFQDGRIDVYANPTLPPSPVVQQFALGQKIRLIGLTDEELASDTVAGLIGRMGGMQGVIPAGTYGENQVNAEDVRTIGSFVGLGTRADMDDETIYKITKAFWEGAEAQRDNTPWLRNVTLDAAFTQLNMPLHPGAIRYYEEVGLTIPDDLKPAQ